MIRRDSYLQKIRPFIGKEIIKVMTGLRRCGKSVMLDLIKQELVAEGIASECCINLNFESRAIDAVKSVDSAYAHIKGHAEQQKGKLYLFLDEIQELTGWEKLVNALTIDFNTDIFITGSNANLLSGELATYLSGRYVEIKIYPFSFKEVITLHQLKEAEVDVETLFHEYIKQGGMPYIHQNILDEQSETQYLQDLYNSILLKDVTQRNKIRNISLLERFMGFLMLNNGNTFSAASLSQYLKNEGVKASNETFYNYLSYGQSACFFHLVPRKDIKGKRILAYQEKIYLTDHGFREAVFGANMRDINQVLENIIFMELLRRGYTITIGKVGEKEVDFIGSQQGEMLYIQVAYLLASKATVELEFSVLEEIADNFPKYVVSMDTIDMSRNGIIHMNIQSFLLSDHF